MKKLAVLVVLMCQAFWAQAEVIYRLDGDDIGLESFWTNQNLTNLLNKLSTSSLTISPGLIGIPSVTGQSGKGLSTNGAIFQWTSFQPLSGELTTVATNGSNYYLNRANHNGTQLLNTISNAGALAALNTVTSSQIEDGTIVSDDIANGAVIIGKLSSSLYSTGGNAAADAGKFVQMQTNGEITATNTISVKASLGTSYGQLQSDVVTFQNVGGEFGRFYTLQVPAITGSRFIYLPSQSGTVARIEDITLTQLPQTSATTGQAIVWNGSSWTPGTVSSSVVIGSTTISSGTAGRLLYETAGNKVGEISGATSNGTALTLVAPILGTPASGTLSNCSGLPISTGVSGLGTSVATFLVTPTFANLNAALTGDDAAGLGTANPFTAANTFTLNAQGLTPSAAVTIQSTTAATSSASEMSPSFVLRGSGWKTNTTAASQTVDFIQNVLPVQGTSAPTGQWQLQYAINGGSAVSAVVVAQNGDQVNGPLTAGVPTAGRITAYRHRAINRFELTANGTNYELGAGSDFNNAFALRRDWFVAWSSSADAAGAKTLLLGRDAAFTTGLLQLGVDDATTPTGQTIRAHSVTTGTGASLTLAGGKGSTAGGSVILGTSTNSGSTSNRLVVGATGQSSFTADANTAIVNVSGTVSGAGASRAAVTISDVWTASSGSTAPRLLDLDLTDSGATSIDYSNTTLIRARRNSSVMFSVNQGGGIFVTPGFYVDPNGNKVQLPSNWGFNFNGDAWLFRGAANQFIVGVVVSGSDAADQEIKAASATGTNKAGADLTLSSGDSTGTSNSAVIFKTPKETTSGSTVTTAVERARIDSKGVRVGNLIIWSDAATAPSTNPPTGCFYLYVDPTDGSLCGRSSLGNTRIITPP